MKQKAYGTALLIGSTVLWGSSFAVRKMGMEQIGPLMQNAARFFVAFCFMGLVILLQHFLNRRKGIVRQEKLPIKLQLKNGIIIGTVFATGSAFQQIGLLTIDAGKTGFITSVYTVLVPVISCLFFKTEIEKKIWIGMMMSLVGLFFITGGGMHFETGYLILLAGSVLFALHIILIGKYVHSANPLILAFAQLAAGAVINFVMAIIMQESIHFPMIRDSLAVILYTGIFSLGIANVLQFISQKMISPSVAAIICSFESVFSLVFGIVLLGEHVTVIQSFGALLIFSAALVSQMKERVYK